MRKTKLLYDIEQLLMFAGRETGICRMSLEVLKQISKHPKYEVYPILTIQKGENPEKYLKEKGLGYLVPNLVKMPYLKKTAQSYNLYKKIRCWFLTQKYTRQYMHQLNQYDEYISLFSPISPIVYKSRMKTKMIIHDLFPLLLPQTCIPSFVRKFRSWIRQVKADEIIFDSQSTLKDFLKFRPDYPEKQVKVVYLAADENFKPTIDRVIYGKYKIPTQKYVLCVSDFNPRKNLLYVINSFIQFLEESKVQDISLVMVGPETDGYQLLLNQVSNIKTHKDKIIFTGYVMDSDMPALYSQAVAFLYPSLYEGFGLPILEAMQCGTPVVTCKNSSLPEVGGDAVLYVSETDVQEMADAMAELYNNPQKREELCQKGIQNAQRFSWDKTVQQIFNLK